MRWNYEMSEAAEAGVTVYDVMGSPLALGAERSLSGGAQGRVYEFPENRDVVVKVYADEALRSVKKRCIADARIESMLRNRRCAANSSLAWPILRCYDKDGRIKGYAMRRIEGFVSFKALFGGGARVERRFPGWTRRDLADVARAFLKTVDQLERSHVVICDWNPDNFLVNGKHEVRFIDTDSYEIHERHGVKILSEMFFAESAAPELLLDRSLLAEPRTVEQTRFSAAVIVFQLLMCGVHPYAFAGQARDGSYVGTPEQNIVAGTCPLGRGADCQLNAVSYNLWSWMTGRLKNAFIATFRDGHSNPSVRTPLTELGAAVDQFIHEMRREPMRMQLAPAVAKDKDWKQAHPFVGSDFGN